MARLFVAIWPPDDVLDRAAALDRPAVPGLRWTTRDQWHITLRFLGQVAEVEPVVGALATVTFPAATAVLGPAVARFGQRIVHVPVAGLDQIASAVIRASAHVGEPPDERPFSGHLTLARAAKKAKVDLRPVTGSPMEAAWEVDSVCLVESRLSPKGARYEVIEEFPVTPPRQPGAVAGKPGPLQDGGPRRTR